MAVAPDRDADPVRCFKTFTGDLREMAAWLARCGITTVAMESTGVYWIPPYQVLEEAGMRVCLVNSQHVRHVPGRKSDVSDCQWLQYLHSVGLLKSSFRPDAAICALRSLSRHRASLVDSAAVHIQHMHKALTQMNLQIHNVLSDITGVSLMAIIEAIVAGQHDPLRLAALCNPKVHADQQTVIKSLVGHYRPEHLFTLKQSLAAYKSYQHLMAECDQEIQRLTGTMPGKIDTGCQPPSANPSRQKRRKNQFHFDMRSELHRLFGVDLTAVPGISSNKKSGGKILSSKTRSTNSRLSHALRVAAQTLARSRSYLGNFYRSMRARLRAPQAITATAHKLAPILYHLLTTGTGYDESVFAREQQKQNLRLHKRLSKQAERLGFQLIPIPAGVPCS